MTVERGGTPANLPYDAAGAATAEQTRALAAEATKAPTLTRTAVKTAATYTAAANELVPVDTTSNAVTVTLPNAPATGTRIAVKHIIQGGTNAVSVVCAGSDVFNKASGATTVPLPLVAQAVLLDYDATTHIWTVLADDLPLADLDLRFAPISGSTAYAATAHHTQHEFGGADALTSYMPRSSLALALDLRRRQTSAIRDQVGIPDRFVDSAHGSDSNDGLTPATAWLTLAKVNTTVTTALKIGLRRGSVFREAHTVPADGMTYGAYGPPELGKPKVKTSKDFSGLTWTLHSGSIYKTTGVAGQPASTLEAWYDDTESLYTRTQAGVTVVSVATMTAGTIWSDTSGTTIYVWMPDGSSPAGHTLELGNLTGSVFTCAKANVTVQDISLLQGQAANNVFWFNATVQAGGQIKRCNIGPHYKTGIIWNQIGGLIEDCDIHHCWDGMLYSAGVGYGLVMTTGTDGTEVRYNRFAYCYKNVATINANRDIWIHHNSCVRAHVNNIDCGGGTIGYPTRVNNNFVWHRPTTGNGHGIDEQAATTGIMNRNNVVYCDYSTASPTNVECYCIDATNYTAADTYIDYNLGFLAPGSTASYGKLGVTTYATLADFQAALNGTSYGGKEAHSLSVDPLVTNLAAEDFTLQTGSPAINAGVAIGNPTEFYLGAAPDLGRYEMA